MKSDALIEEIDAAYLRLSAATDELARSDRELAEYVRRVRLDNAEAILEARNERTANLSVPAPTEEWFSRPHRGCLRRKSRSPDPGAEDT